MAMVEDSGIAHGVTNGIGRIILQRPEQGNAIGLPGAHALARAIGAVLQKRPRVILLLAEGRMFCAGGDLSEFAEGLDGLAPLIDAILASLHPAVQKLHEAPVPVITAINGPVAGAGVGLALCADFVLGAESMKLRTGYVALGFTPDAGTSWHLARRVGAVRAQQWLMTNDAIDAQACLRAGAIDQIVPDAELRTSAEALAERLRHSAPGAIAGIKNLCAGIDERSLADQLALERSILVRQAGGDNAREGILAFVEKRPPQFTQR